MKQVLLKQLYQNLSVKAKNLNFVVVEEFQQILNHLVVGEQLEKRDKLTPV